MACQRCLIPASGFWEPEKPARAPGNALWSYYSMKDGRPFFVAGLWSDAPDLITDGIADSYTMVIGEANAVMWVHDRMPAILGTEAARRWLEPGPLQAALLVPYPAEEMQIAYEERSAAERTLTRSSAPSVLQADSPAGTSGRNRS